MKEDHDKPWDTIGHFFRQPGSRYAKLISLDRSERNRVNPPTTLGLWFSQNCLLSVMKKPKIRLLNLGLMKNHIANLRLGWSGILPCDIILGDMIRGYHKGIVLR